MKAIANLKLKCTKLFILLFLLLTIAGVRQRANAQSSYVLLNSEWTLQESSVNDDTNNLSILAAFLIPDNFGNYSFIFEYGYINCLKSFKVNFTDVTESSFNLSTVHDYVPCDYTNPDEIEAVQLYQSFYFNLPFGTNSTPKNPFTYEWVDNGHPVVDLVITNPDGDWLLYRRAYLSTPAAKKNSFRLYPNPTENILNLSSANNTISEVTISIYDMLGKLVKFENNKAANSNISLNVSHLKSGLYFITIESKEGFKQNLKFVKQ